MELITEVTIKAYCIYTPIPEPEDIEVCVNVDMASFESIEDLFKNDVLFAKIEAEVKDTVGSMAEFEIDRLEQLGEPIINFKATQLALEKAGQLRLPGQGHEVLWKYRRA